MSDTTPCITPVIIPHIGWQTFLKDATDAVGHSLTKSIDTSGQNVSDYTKLLIVLQELHTGFVCNPIDVLQEANLLLEHLSFSFLISGSTIMILKLLESTALPAVSGKMMKEGRVVLFSGTLGKWKLATIDLCNSDHADLRWCGQSLLEFFFRVGLRGIFANYDRKIRPDGTLLLEHK